MSPARAAERCVVVALLVGVAACKEPPLPEVIAAAFDASPARGGLALATPQDGTIYPAGLPPPVLTWTDDHAASNAWLLTFSFSAGEKSAHLTHFREWTPPADVWSDVQRRSTGRPAELTVVGVDRARPGTILSSGRATFETSVDPIGAPVFYREVNLPFIDAVKDPTRIRWRFGSATSASLPPVVLEHLPVCGNCHSFSADGRWLGMDVDYANDKGSYALARVEREIGLSRDKIITWADYRREDGTPTFGLLSQVSPDGRFVVSTVKDRSVFVPRPDLAFSQLFFPVKGILAVYDRQTKQFHSLPGADDPRYVQTNPSWSPDGEHIVFARTEAADLGLESDRVLLTSKECKQFMEGGRKFRFDLYRIPFNGGRGGAAEPLQGACCDGRSNFFARYSPDGRWIVFNKADSFMLLQPDSELFIMPAAGGAVRRMRANTRRMNSWHSWSPNSRWLIFSSKANGPYTQLFLTHVDPQGMDAPAVALPHLTSKDRAANIPEFVNASPSAIQRVREQFVDALSFLRAGHEFLDARDLSGAEHAFRKALELEPGHAEAHKNLAFVLGLQGRFEAALPHHEAALKGLPADAEAHNSQGVALAGLGRLEPALASYREALRLDPRLAPGHNNTGIVLERQGRRVAAVLAYREALRLDPSYVKAHNNLGLALRAQGRLDEAAGHHQAALRTDPDYGEAHEALGRLRAAQGRLDEAVSHLARATELSPHSVAARNHLGIARARRGDLAAAVSAFRAALGVDPRSVDAHHNLGLALERLGRPGEARSHRERAAQLRGEQR